MCRLASTGLSTSWPNKGLGEIDDREWDSMVVHTFILYLHLLCSYAASCVYHIHDNNDIPHDIIISCNDTSTEKSKSGSAIEKCSVFLTPPSETTGASQPDSQRASARAVGVSVQVQYGVHKHSTHPAEPHPVSQQVYVAARFLAISKKL